MKQLFCIGLLLLPLTGFPAQADQYGSGKSMETVALSIEGIHRDLGTYSVTVESLKTLLAEKLNSAGVRVIDIDELTDHPEAAVINLRLTLNRAPYYFYLYGLNMSVRNQLATRDGGGFTTIKTWSNTRNGMLMPRDAGDIKRMSLEMLDKLLRDSGRG